MATFSFLAQMTPFSTLIWLSKSRNASYARWLIGTLHPWNQLLSLLKIQWNWWKIVWAAIARITFCWPCEFKPSQTASVTPSGTKNQRSNTSGASPWSEPCSEKTTQLLFRIMEILSLVIQIQKMRKNECLVWKPWKTSLKKTWKLPKNLTMKKAFISCTTFLEIWLIN